MPNEGTNRRCVALRFNLQQLIDSIRVLDNAHSVLTHPAFVSSVEEQLECEFLSLPSNKLLQRRIKTGDRDFSKLDTLVPGQLRRVVLKRDVLSSRLSVDYFRPFDVQQSFGYLF